MSKAIYRKGKKEAITLLKSLRKLKCIDLVTFLKLFDTQVKPVLKYGDEIC